MRNDELSAVVLFERQSDADLRAIAAAITRELAEGDDDGEAPSGAIALPVAEGRPRLESADVALVLDAASAERARAARVPRVAALLPRLAFDWDGPLDVDLVLVPHEALVEEVVARGVPAARVRTTGPVAPDGWAPAEDRAALRARLGPRAAAPWVVVRAAALEDDPAAALVQLSLVRRSVAWLFDVGGDAELARALRRRVPGYGLDAVMFADGPDALGAYQAADAVLGRIEGVEVLRAAAVGAALATMPPRSDQLRLAHVLESSGVADVADAPATLAVTLDRALEEEALARGRAAVAALEAGAGAARVAAVLRQLARGELPSAGASGLPVGLERLGAPDERPPERLRSEPPPKRADDLDRKVDEELAALRQKLGL